MSIPTDYVERVYAGVLGKLIGVYLGRPFEGWTYERIMDQLGEIEYYVHDQFNVPLVVTDDDISGTFTFLRALPDYDNRADLTPAQIGQTWLNYIIENRTILWWGGMGNSTEHTAYLRLKSGVEAPRSGSMALNGKVVAEQIGSQIFIDGWAMIAPGDPERAADFARRAASVSHDGEAIYGAQVIAAMEAAAFIESDINTLIDTAVALIPKDSVIYRMIADIREWHAKFPDWHEGRAAIAEHYGYDKYGGNCHMVPNHGLIIFSLLYGDDDFQKSLMIVNTSGWDTDCNSGNVGCLLGIKNGLAGINSDPDWRGPVADRLYLPTADGGRSISDAVTETYHIVNIGRALAGEAPLHPKQSARFHFELPGSVQGFQAEDSNGTSGSVTLENVPGHSQQGARALALHYDDLSTDRPVRAATPTFIPSEAVATYFERRGYQLHACPTIYPGQTLRARLSADAQNAQPVDAVLYMRHYAEDDALTRCYGPVVKIAPGESCDLEWQVPDTDASPIAFVGLEVRGEQGTSGTVYLDYLTWDGTPQADLGRPDYQGSMWKRAWVNGLDHMDRLMELDFWPEPFRLIQNEGRGLLVQGAREWTDYSVSAHLRPHMCKATGVGARVQGMRRYYALLLCDDDHVRLVRQLDGETILAEAAYDWRFGAGYHLRLEVHGDQLRGFVNDQLVIQATDSQPRLAGGAAALICEEGRVACYAVTVGPVSTA